MFEMFSKNVWEIQYNHSISQTILVASPFPPFTRSDILISNAEFSRILTSFVIGLVCKLMLRFLAYLTSHQEMTFVFVMLVNNVIKHCEGFAFVFIL